MRFWYHWRALNFLFPMIPKSHDLDKWMAKYFVSKMKYIEILKKRRKDIEKCTIQYLFSMSVSFPYHFSIFSVSEFFIGLVIAISFLCHFMIIIIIKYAKKYRNILILFRFIAKQS